MLNDEEIFLCEVSKRIGQFERHIEPIFLSNKNLIKSLRVDSSLLDSFHKFSQDAAAADPKGNVLQRTYPSLYWFINIFLYCDEL